MMQKLNADMKLAYESRVFLHPWQMLRGQAYSEHKHDSIFEQLAPGYL